MAERNARAKAPYEIVFYGGAMHSFTNPEANAPERAPAYNAHADQRSPRRKEFWPKSSRAKPTTLHSLR
jgi:dienelactone hydrolase